MDRKRVALELDQGFLLDTHYWLWLQKGDATNVRKEFFAEVENWQRSGRVYVSAISVWEIAFLVAHKQILLDRSVEHWVESGTEDGGFQILPLTTRILIESTRLPGEVHGDPADRLLAATAREHNFTLVTRDKKLLAYGKAGHVRTRKV